MKKKLCLIGILLTIVIGALLQYYFCCSTCQDLEERITPVTVGTPLQDPNQANIEGFAIVSDPLKLQHPDNFTFVKNSYEIHQPVSEKLNDLVNEAATHFVANPSKMLEIIGYYSDDEPNPSVFPTIGLARANAVKVYFEQKGFPARQIKISDKQNNQLSQNLEIPTRFTIFQVGEISEDMIASERAKLEEFAAELRKNPIRLYFETGETQIGLTQEERIRINALNNYVTHVEDARIQVIGNTDNVGNRASNLRLGQERAEFIKNYLTKNNFSEFVIEAISYGPDKPIESNKTLEGRAKNRRVEITLK